MSTVLALRWLSTCGVTRYLLRHSFVILPFLCGVTTVNWYLKLTQTQKGHDLHQVMQLPGSQFQTPGPALVAHTYRPGVRKTVAGGCGVQGLLALPSKAMPQTYKKHVEPKSTTRRSCFSSLTDSVFVPHCSSSVYSLREFKEKVLKSQNQKMSRESYSKWPWSWRWRLCWSLLSCH